MEYPEEKNTFGMEDEFLLGMSVSYFFKKMHQQGHPSEKFGALFCHF